MEKEIKLNLQKFSRIFTSSCKTQDLSEVIDHKNPVFTPEISFIEQNDDDPFPITRPKQENQQQTPLSSFGSPYYSTSTMMMCKPRCPESFDQMILQNCIIPTSGNSHSRRKISGRYSLLSPAGDFSGRRCPPASPASPLKQSKKQSTRKKKKKTERKVKDFNKYEKTHLRNNPFSFSSSNETDCGDWFSSDDEREDEDLEETETLFSSSFKSLSFSSKSISLSSDSEPCNATRTRSRSRPRRRRRRTSSRIRKEGSGSRPDLGPSRAGPEKDVGVVPLQGKVKDTFAVVKSSSDPYNDFRTSMVEMIIEKQIFGTKELEQLLQCFLSLNSPHHHRVIVEVFTEIWDALFSYCS